MAVIISIMRNISTARFTRIIRRISVLSATAIIAAALVAGITGCSWGAGKTADELRSITEEYVEDVGLGEAEGQTNYEKLFPVIEHGVSLAEVIKYREPEIDSGKKKATMTVTLSYIDWRDFGESVSGEYLTVDDLIARLDSYDERAKETVKVTFEMDEDTGEWSMTRKSQRRITGILTGDAIEYLPTPVNYSPSQAEEFALEFIHDVAEDGVSDMTDSYRIENYQAYDNVLGHGTGPATQAALQNYVAAYMSYVISHGYSVSHGGDNPYRFTISGCAPSADDMYNCFYDSNFRGQFYANYLRVTMLDQDPDEMWENQSALIYNTLAEAIPQCSPETYSLTLVVNGYDQDELSLIISCDFSTSYGLIPPPARGIYEYEHGATLDELIEGYTAAADILRDAGEISQAERNMLVSSLGPETFGFSESERVSPSGHPDQALGVYEQIPEFCTDGSMYYGYSNVDSNGFWMFYSKQAGWLDTAGYYIDTDGVWITCYFDVEFDAGTNLIADWWMDGSEDTVYTETVTVNEDGTSAIEVFLPTGVFPANAASEYELRLWEDDHTHVLAYVVMTNE